MVNNISLFAFPGWVNANYHFILLFIVLACKRTYACPSTGTAILSVLPLFAENVGDGLGTGNTYATVKLQVLLKDWMFWCDIH